MRLHQQAAKSSMISNSRLWHPAFAFVALTVCAFTLLALRFSPNWIAFCREVNHADSQVTNPADRAAIGKAVLSSNCERGYYVAKQALKEVYLTGADFVKFLEKDEAFHNKLMSEAGFAAKK